MSSREALIGNDFQGLIDAAVNAELTDFPSTKKQYWKQIGDALSYAGYPKTELGDEVAERIEARFFELHKYSISVRTAHYYDCKKEWGWIRKPKNAEPQTEEKQAVEKDIYNPTPETGEQNSSQHEPTEKPQYTPKAEYGLENKRLIDTIGDVCSMADALRDYMRHNPFLSKMDPALIDEITARLTAWVTNMRDAMNNKQIVPINTQVMILQLYNMASDINNLFGMYFDEIKRIHVLERTRTKKTNQILTSKEIIKYQRRDLKGMSEILEFHDANEARMSGYYGQQCKLCMGFRTMLAEGNNNKVVCVRCKGRDEIGMKREIFYTCMQCRYLVENPEKGKCEHCGFEYVYPANL